MTKEKKPAKKAPTLAEVRRVVRAWVAENWPDAKHVDMSRWGAHGGAIDSVDLLGPPTDIPWFTNDIRPYPPGPTIEG